MERRRSPGQGRPLTGPAVAAAVEGLCPAGPGAPAGAAGALSLSDGGGAHETRIVLSSYTGLIFVIVTCSLCIPMFVAGIVMTSVSLNNSTVTMYRTGVSLLAVSVFVAAVSIVMVLVVCSGFCPKRGATQTQRTAAGGTRRAPITQQILNQVHPITDSLRRQFSARSSAIDLGQGQPPPYIYPYTTVEPFYHDFHEALSAPAPDRRQCEVSHAWTVTNEVPEDLAVPRLLLPPYSLHQVPIKPYPGLFLSGTVIAWEVEEKDDQPPPSYDESFREARVFPM